MNGNGFRKFYGRLRLEWVGEELRAKLEPMGLSCSKAIALMGLSGPQGEVRTTKGSNPVRLFSLQGLISSTHF